MCGLVGIAGQIGFKGEKVFRRLLELDTTRGAHSTGICHVDNKGEANVLKKVGTPWDLYQYKQCEELFRKSSNVLLGHNRFATKGKINATNAHPFEFENVVGAHNGTLKTTYQLDDHAKFDVDSENIYYDMNKNGVYETIPKLNGAYTLTWYDKKDATINFIRNEERPLYYTFSKDMKTLLWASEPWMIVVAAGSHDMEIEAVQALPINTLHTFEVPLGFGIAATPFEKARIRVIEGFKEKKTYRAPVIGTSNVRELRPAGKAAVPFTTFNKYLSKEIVFYVGKKMTSTSNQSYLQCWAADDDNVQVRVFPAVDGELWKKMALSTSYFKGVAKAYNGLEGGYLTVDIRTIEETDLDIADACPWTIEDGEEEETLYEGWNGYKLTKVQWEHRAKKCSWCSSPVDIVDHKEILWLDGWTVCCPVCSIEPEILKYIGE